MLNTVRTIDWRSDEIVIIDQRALPLEERILRLHTVDELVAAIQGLADHAPRLCGERFGTASANRG